MPVNHLATKIHRTVRPAVTRTGIKTRRNLMYYSLLLRVFIPFRDYLHSNYLVVTFSVVLRARASLTAWKTPPRFRYQTNAAGKRIIGIATASAITTCPSIVVLLLLLPFGFVVNYLVVTFSAVLRVRASLIA